MIIVFKKKKTLFLLTIVLLVIFIPSITLANQPPEIDSTTLKYYNVIYNIVYSRSGLGQEWSNWITWTIINNSYKYSVNPLLIAALFATESDFRPDAISPMGAIGIAQLMPATAKSVGVKRLDDPAQNIEGGIIYFRQQLDTFNNAGNWGTSYAVAAYNAGPEAIKDHAGIPPYRETINYLNRVGSLYKQLESNFLSLG